MKEKEYLLKNIFYSNDFFGCDVLSENPLKCASMNN